MEKTHYQQGFEAGLADGRDGYQAAILGRAYSREFRYGYSDGYHKGTGAKNKS
jgi:hypothetical protein